MSAKTPKDERKVAEQLLGKTRKRRNDLSERLAAERASKGRRNDMAPELRLVLRAIDRLRAARRRVRKTSAAQITRIANAIARLGFCLPILITADDEIIDGHERVEAAKQLGFTEITCVVIDHLDDEEIRVLRIALNRIAEKGSWDFDELRLEFKELIELGAPIELSGFELPEIDIVLAEEEPPALEEGEVEVDPEREQVTQPGDVWALGEHLIACGDARDQAVAAFLFADGRKAQLIGTDVPFNVAIENNVTRSGHKEFAMASGEMSREEFIEFNLAWFSVWLQHLVDGGLFASFIDWRSVEIILAVGRMLGLELLNLIVWNKSKGGMGSMWRSQHELFPVFKAGRAPHRNNIQLGRFGRDRSNVWSYPGATTMGSDAREGLKSHPTVKPVSMLQDALLDMTNVGDIVVDPFLGSGSTLIACEKSGRICRAVEIDPGFVDVAIRRWIDLTGKTPVLIGQVGDAPPRERPAAQLRLPSNRLREAG